MGLSFKARTSPSLGWWPLLTFFVPFVLFVVFAQMAEAKSGIGVASAVSAMVAWFAGAGVGYAMGRRKRTDQLDVSIDALEEGPTDLALRANADFTP